MEPLREKDYSLSVWGAGTGAPRPVVWLHGADASRTKTVFSLLHRPCALIGVGGQDWNRDFSPWPAPQLNAKNEPFSGGAAAYRALFLERLLPAAERRLPFAPPCRLLAGYSLAGLFCMDTLYAAPLFHGAACVSGSLWYDGWAQWAMKHSFACEAPRLYLSLGDQEGRVRNARMARIASCTEALAAHWSHTAPLRFEWNPGGHFHEPEQRLARGIDALLAL